MLIFSACVDIDCIDMDKCFSGNLWWKAEQSWADLPLFFSTAYKNTWKDSFSLWITQWICWCEESSQGPQFCQESLHIWLPIGAAAADRCVPGGWREGCRLTFHRFHRLFLQHPLSVHPGAVTRGVPIPSTQLWTRSGLRLGCALLALNFITGLIGMGSFDRCRACIYILPRARPL